MFKISLDKKTFTALAIVVAVGILFLLVLRMRYARPPKVLPPEEVPTYAKKLLKERIVKDVRKPLPERGIIPRAPMEIHLPLRLVGLYQHGGEKVAYIENLATSQTGEYKIGDIIMGATLIQILSSQVVLQKDSNRIVLNLGRFHSFEDTDEWIGALSKDSFVVSRPQLNKKVRDINEVLSEAIPVPYVRSGKIEGIRLSSLKEDGIISHAGFEEGDVVKSINGQRVDSLKKPIQIYKYLRDLVDSEEDPIIRIEFEREKKTHTFTYRILKE